MEEDHASCNVHTHSDHIKLRAKWIFSLIFIPVSIFLLKPFIAKQIVYRASAYSASFMYQDSIRQYKKALFIDGDNADGWIGMADVYKITEDVEEAISSYGKAIETEPQNRKALYSLGMTLALKKQQYEEAKRLWDEVRKLGPESADERDRYRFSYHRLSLHSLVAYYKRINDPDSEAEAQKELNSYYPDAKDAGGNTQAIDDNSPDIGEREEADTSP